jgi:hypothetical protein
MAMRPRSSAQAMTDKQSLQTTDDGRGDGPVVMYVNHTAKMAGAEYSLLDLLRGETFEGCGLGLPSGTSR